MKYTLHFSGFYDNIRLNTTHISLYLALFQLLKLNYFQKFSSIFRNEIIKLSKITVFGTYHKRIKDIKSFPQIEYLPSFNFCKKCILNLYNFDERAVQNPNSYHTKNQTSSAQALNQHHIKIDTGIEQELIPSINYINILNNKHSITTHETCSNFKQAFLLFIPHEEIVPKTLNQNFKEKEKLRQKKKKDLSLTQIEKNNQEESKKKNEQLSPTLIEENIQDGGKKNDIKLLPVQAHKISTNLAEVKIFCKKRCIAFDAPRHWVFDHRTLDGILNFIFQPKSNFQFYL